MPLLHREQSKAHFAQVDLWPEGRKRLKDVDGGSGSQRPLPNLVQRRWLAVLVQFALKFEPIILVIHQELKWRPIGIRILGREAELSEMLLRLNGALAGERHTIFVTGEPGIGKTTIVQAFLEQASEVTDILVARGQCLEHYGAAEPHLPVLDGFSRLLRSPGGSVSFLPANQATGLWIIGRRFISRETPSAMTAPILDSTVGSQSRCRHQGSICAAWKRSAREFP